MGRRGAWLAVWLCVGAHRAGAQPAPVAGVVTREVDRTGAPVDAATAFPEDTPRLFVSLQASADTPGVRVQWTTLRTEDGTAGRTLCSARTALSALRRASVRCDAPRGGFAAGEYRVDVLGADGAKLLALPFRITPVGAPALPALGLERRTNLAAAAAGGRVRLVTDEVADDWAAIHLIDGKAPEATATRAQRGTAWGTRAPPPHEVVFSFYREQSAMIDAVVLDPRVKPGGASMPKLVEIWVSREPRLGAGMTRVARARLFRQGREQAIAFPPTPARFLSLRILSTYGEPPALAEVRVLEAPGDSILTQATLPEAPPGEGVPIARPVIPRDAAALTAAKPLAIGDAVNLGVEGWNVAAAFRFEVTGSKPVLLHLGALAAAGARVVVYGADGEPLFLPGSRPGASWHGKLVPGTYFAKVTTWGTWSKPLDDSPGAREGATAAVFAIEDPILEHPTPFEAAQRGLDYVQVEASGWQNLNRCSGCHVQTEALLGMVESARSGHRVVPRVARALGELLASTAPPNDRDLHQLFRQVGLRLYIDGFAPEREPVALALGKALLSSLPERFVFPGEDRPPVEQGTLTATALAVQVLAPLARHAPEADAEAFRRATASTLAALKAMPPRTVQDHAMRVLAFRSADAPDDAVADEVGALLTMQNRDGGFGETPGGGISNAYGTGQALFALRVAGLPVTDARFARGVAWLMEHQRWDGAWPLMATRAKSDIAHTMWAVVGLAGSYDRNGPIATAKPLEVLLVPVRVVARESGGRTLSDLTASDLRVLEDGRPQPVVRVTRETGDLSVAIVIDTSGSVRRALPTMLTAAREFLRLLRRRDRTVLVEFNDAPRLAAPLSMDRAPLGAALEGLQAHGGTALYDAVGLALDQLASEPSPSAIVLITDGKDENDPATGPGSQATLQATLTRLSQAQVPVYVIGLGRQVERRTLTSLAGASGGRAYFVNMPRELPRLYADLASVLRSQYLVVYRSTRPQRDGKWRKIAVKIARPRVSVEATPGFFAE